MSLEDKIKTYAKQYDLSDFHIRSNQPLALRENGSIVVNQEDIISREDIETFWKSSLNKSQLQEIVSNRDLDFAVVVGDFRYRVNGYYSSNGPCMVLRKIVSDIPQMEKLGLPDAVKEAIKLKNGLILVTGQTGSGKSTSLAAMIDQINSSRAENIITIEDPIEFVHPSKKSIISQREVGKDTGSFARALKSALRQDPDVILVGEMRDLETISLALTAAETGHLVFGTLHASNVSSTITRVLDVFPPAQKTLAQSMLAGSIRLVLSQQLLKKKGGGRIGCFEVMTGTTAIRNLIREGKMAQITSTLQTSAKEGMITMEKYLEGLNEKDLVE
ncbi:PilT/PilU family type 4a pilus ATPase [Candidatus Pelagibacter sp.]|jgi:twitching motility protein PilT|nr:PilT/PilU family type 4a pilus ATPase [Candidatus Pelagibacter bacterium]MDC1112844.1 PilT/PilU family type 4a pilus ATPase [Candidatus Pelagibacter sp.]MDC1178375.1 PilT/PilU family type 4a pilus ATPase [Candidatus Pelagibacter sp.]